MGCSRSGPYHSSVAPLKSLYFHWTALCSSSIVFTPRSLFLLFVLLFSGPIVEDLTAAATQPPPPPCHRVDSLERDFTPYCLSSPRCINGYRRRTAGGILFVFCIYLPHIINYTITITKRYKNVESNGEKA